MPEGTWRPLLLLGAGASNAFGIPTMPEFLKDDWRTMDERSTAGALAVRRSLELTEMADLEEVMYLLDALAEMRREDAIAAPFLPRFTTKGSELARVLDFERVRQEAFREREDLRRLIYRKCTDYDRERVWATYPPMLTSLFGVSTEKIIYVVTTNYDRIIEELWEDETRGLQMQVPRLELQTGFHRRPYGNAILDIDRGYPDPGKDADRVVRLIKIHGSLGWRAYQPGRVEETGAREYPQDFAVLAYPVREDKSKEPPFSLLYQALERALTSTNLIVIIGMSLRDVAIVGRLADSLRDGRKRAIVIDPAPEIVRDRLPQEVRQYVRTMEGRFAADVRLGTIEDWQQVFSVGSGAIG